MSASRESLPQPFQRLAEADGSTASQVAQRVFRFAILGENPYANPDYPYFLLQTNTAGDRISFIRSFRNRFTALSVGRQMENDDESWGECSPLTAYFTFDVSGKWFQTPLIDPPYEEED